MRLPIPGYLILCPVALYLLQGGCERSTGFCQTTADCADGLRCSPTTSTCQPPAAQDLAPPVAYLPHLGTRVQNPPAGLPGDFFGYAVATTSTFAVFGSHLARGAQGAVYVADLTSTTCGPPVALSPPDTPAAFDYFGVAVAASVNTIAVGAYNKDGGKGAVYIYTKTNNVWSPVPTKLVAFDGVAGDLFGISVSLYADTLAVGAYNKNAGQGAAYVFSRTGTVWSAAVKVPAPMESQPVALDYFGQQVSAAPAAVAVGAPGRLGGRGAVYLYKFDSAKLTATIMPPSPYAMGSTPIEQFGGALSLTPNLLAIGSAGYSPSAQLAGQGAVYLYNVAVPLPPVILTAADPGPRQRFGFAVSQVPALGAVADTLLVGAPGREQAFVFRRNLPTPWTQTAVLDVSPDGIHAGFGSAVATSGTQHLVGLRGVLQDVGGAYFFPDP